MRSGVTDVGPMGEPSPWQAKSKSLAPLADILIFRFVVVFRRLLFFCIFQVFSFF